MLKIKSSLLISTVFMFMPISGFTQYSVKFLLTPPVEKYIEIGNCGGGGSWECVVKNKTNQMIDLHNFYAVGYDKDGVKEGENNLYQNIDANGAVRVGFAQMGSITNVVKIVISPRQCNCANQLNWK